MTQQQWPPLAPTRFDLEQPSAARIYDWLLGGERNYAIDRRFGERAVANCPVVKELAWCNRDFLARAVRQCARRGVTQFLDIGSGLPTAGNVHEVADEVDTRSRCVYVDSESVAVAHANIELDDNGDPDRHAVVQADLRDVNHVWQEALGTGVLDPEQPIALITVATLHFVPPAERAPRSVRDKPDAHAALAQYRELLPPDSRLILTHVTEEGVPEDLLPPIRAFVAQYENSSTPVCFRSRAEIEDFFGDFELVEPGVAWLPDWHPEEQSEHGNTPEELFAEPARSCVLGGVARKPR